MNARAFINFFNTKAGQFTAFAVVAFVLGALIWGFTHGASGHVDNAPKKPQLEEPEAKAPKSSFFGIPDASFANKSRSIPSETNTGPDATPPSACDPGRW